MATSSQGYGQATAGDTALSATGGSVVDRNKAIVRRLFDEGINQRNTAVFYEMLAPTFVLHYPMAGPPLTEANGLRQIVGVFLAAFPDLHFAIDTLIGENDLVCVHAVVTGTNLGPWHDHPPTGRCVSYTATGILSVQAAKIAAMTINDDRCGLLQQLGLITLPQ
ncbi:MAG: ester cyclase [Candidatus Sericytochromatia bacterium]|nr:ester cyclase [Candidatus Sericytochromatia bacterium]